MIRNREWLLVVFLSAALSFVVLLPYLLAEGAPPQDADFGGLLVNPIDGFSYLAKMRPGVEGRWLLTWPYAAEPGAPVALYLYPILLGHVSRLSGLSLLAVYHGARIVFTFAMGITFYLCSRALHMESRTRLLALGFFLFASGLGWLAAPLGLQSVDLLVPEAIPFYAALTNAHFPLTWALLALAAWSAIDQSVGLRARWLVLFFSGAGLGIVQPFGALSLGLVLALWIVWEWIILRKIAPHEDIKGAALQQASLLIAFGSGAGPWLLYDIWITSRHPVLIAWNAQNLTPSLPLAGTLIGYGLILVWAVVGVWRARPFRSAGWRLMLVWLLANGLLIYAPFNLQRRFTLGWFLPLVFFALRGIRTIAGKRRQVWMAALTLAVSVPSLLLVWVAGPLQVRQGNPYLVLLPGELEAYRWIEENVDSEALVLAGEIAGNRLPALSGARVLYGHPFETPQAARTLGEIESWFAAADATPPGLLALNPEYVFYGPQERSWGNPDWLERYQVVFESGEVQVLRSSQP